MLRAISMSSLSQDCSGSFMKRRLVYSYFGLVVVARSEWMSLYRLFSQIYNDSRVGYFLLVCRYTAGSAVISCICGTELWAGLTNLELAFASMYSMLAGGFYLLVILLISSLVSSLWVLWLALIHSALMGVLEGPDISYSFNWALLESGRESDCQWLLLVLYWLAGPVFLGLSFLVLSTLCFSGVLSLAATSQYWLFTSFVTVLTGMLSISSLLICGKRLSLNRLVLNLASELWCFLILGGLVQEKEMLAGLLETALEYLNCIFLVGLVKTVD